MTFGEKLKYIRKQKGYSQEQLAEMLGSSKQVISRYENSLRTPKVTVVSEFASKLDVPIQFLADNSIDSIEDARGQPATETSDGLPPDKQALIDIIMGLSDHQAKLAREYLELLIEKQNS